ncbi:MAG: lysylphosphatidylglycerol synthase transmembrane domain-containing protein [Planctomycetota bacterium]
MFAAKAAVAVVLLTWVAWQVHWKDYVVARAPDGDSYAVISPPADGGGIAGTGRLVRPGMATSLRGARWPLLAAAVATAFVPLLLIALRWRRLLAVAGLHLRYVQTVRLTFIGSFFNLVMPGMVGGDLVKAYYAARRVGRAPAVLVSLFADRLVGLAGLVALACGATLIAWVGGLVEGPELRVLAMLVAVAAGGVAALSAFLLSARLRRALHLQKLYERLPIAHHVAAAGEAARAYRARPRALAGALGIAVLTHLAWVVAVILVGRSLSIATSAPRYFIYVPLIYMIGVVPLAPGGLGLLEKCYVVFFASAAVGPSAVLAMALLTRAVQLVCGLSGVVVMIAAGGAPGREALRGELDSTCPPDGSYNT